MEISTLKSCLGSRGVVIRGADYDVEGSGVVIGIVAMATTKEDEKLLKVDFIGRMRTIASQREALLDALLRAALSS